MDDWEDEEFEVKLNIPSKAPGASVASPTFDDEEDLVSQDTAPVIAAPSQAQILAAKKKARDEEIALANQLKFAQFENETPEQRKLRERKQAEDEDAALAGDLFASGTTTSTRAGGTESGSGLGGIPMKTKDDHKNFGILCSKKLANSTSMNITFFYKSVFDKVKDKLSTESLDEILEALSKERGERKKTEPVSKKVAPKKSKKELDAEKKRAAEIFGASQSDDPYDSYVGMEDDFM